MISSRCPLSTRRSQIAPWAKWCPWNSSPHQKCRVCPTCRVSEIKCGELTNECFTMLMIITMHFFHASFKGSHIDFGLVPLSQCMCKGVDEVGNAISLSTSLKFGWRMEISAAPSSVSTGTISFLEKFFSFSDSNSPEIWHYLSQQVKNYNVDGWVPVHEPYFLLYTSTFRPTCFQTEYILMLYT